VKIALASKPVADPRAAFQFYAGILGFVERLYVPEARLAIVASPEEPGGTGLLLEPNDNPISRDYQAGVYDAGLPIIVFGVDDIQQEVERLQSLGVVFRQAPVQTEAGIVALFEDTCGNLIQLFQV
jgi:predicted enzyme related to lactoylglutathione lyase